MPTYIRHGIEHILFGFDHLLFVAALMLIVRNWRVLIKTITAFTIAHSITLTLATVGWVTLPGAPVETAIALSILLVAVEVVRMERGEFSLTITRPWMVAFAFGLLHGFRICRSAGRPWPPHGDLPLALLSFNIGVELGQLLFIGTILLVVYSLKRVFELPRQAVLASAYAIGIVAAFGASSGSTRSSSPECPEMIEWRCLCAGRFAFAYRRMNAAAWPRS